MKTRMLKWTGRRPPRSCSRCPEAGQRRRRATSALCSEQHGTKTLAEDEGADGEIDPMEAASIVPAVRRKSEEAAEEAAATKMQAMQRGNTARKAL